MTESFWNVVLVGPLRGTQFTTMYSLDLGPRSQHGHFQTQLPTLAMFTSRRSFCVRNCWERNKVMPESSLHCVACVLLEFFFFKLALCKILANSSYLQKSINAWQGDNYPDSKIYPHPMFVAKTPTFSQCEAASPLFYSESAISYFCLMPTNFFVGADKEKSPSLCHP